MVAASTGVLPAEVTEPKERPNFLIIMVDDLSPEQFACYGNEVNHTPNLDALAAGGVKFNTAWATPMCSPTRALLVTGRYASRTGVWHNDLRLNCTKQTRWNWVSKHLTFPRVLREHGYRTAIVGNPMALGGSIYSKDVGFDEQCVRALTLQDVPEGSTFTGKFEGKYNFPDAKPVPARYWHPCVIRNGELMETTAEDFGPDLYAGFLIDFIKRHEDQPFLAYYPMNLVHDMAGGGIPTTPVNGTPGSNKGGSLQGLVEYIDILVGRLMDGLEAAGLRENTIVIFTCDNGENGKKMHASEDGPRVPFIVNCPGLIQQRGTTDELMEFSDIYPTLMEFSGASVPRWLCLGWAESGAFLDGRYGHTPGVDHQLYCDLHEWCGLSAGCSKLWTRYMVMQKVDSLTVVMRTCVVTTKISLVRPKRYQFAKSWRNYSRITRGRIYPILMLPRRLIVTTRCLTSILSMDS
jgi:hypothetical protein